MTDFMTYSLIRVVASRLKLLRCVLLGHDFRQRGNGHIIDGTVEYDHWWECERCGRREVRDG